EFPLEGLGCALVAALELEEPVLNLVEVLKVVRGKHLAIDNRQVDLNAVYFHGDWQAPFDSARTRQAPFHRAGAADVTAPLMDRSGEFTYGEGPGYQAVALPTEVTRC